MRVARCCLNSLKTWQCIINSATSYSSISKMAVFPEGFNQLFQESDHLNACSHRYASSISTSDSNFSHPTTAVSADWNNVPVVKAFVHIPKESSKPVIGIYWNASSKQNRLKEHKSDIRVIAEIEAVCLALKQAAFKMNLPRVRVITNSKFVCKHFGRTSLWWSLEEFLRQKAMTFILCSSEAEDLYRLLHMIEADLEYDPTVDKIFDNFSKNIANEKKTNTLAQEIIAVETSAIGTFTSESQNRSAGSEAVGISTRANSTSVGSNSKVINTPVVYTCGVLHSIGDGEKKFAMAGYGIYWPHAEELGTGRRFNFYPITLIRCQLQAIIEALQQAVDRNYRSVILRTDCVTFLVHHSRQWIKSNGSYVRYHDQYIKIMDFCKKIKVKFQSANGSAALKEAEALAENGVCLPLPAKRYRKLNHVNQRISAERKSVPSDASPL